MDARTFFGDSVTGTIVRLVLLSIVVGIVFSALGIEPGNIVYNLRRLIERISALGFGAIESVVGYFLLGAVVVIPIWLVTRLIAGMRRRTDDRR